MASSMCLSCLRRSLRSIDSPITPLVAHRAAFSTTSSLSAAKPGPPKKSVVAKPGARATKTLRIAKKQPKQTTSRPPAPGERKAVRKRIVLSNTNALEVQGLEDLTGDKLLRHAPGSVTLDDFRGQVLGLNNETVDALRALEAFKPRQGWSLFRRPASLMRKETVELANDLASVESEAGKEAVRKVVFGGKGSGKSVLLLQAQAMAFLKDWIVLHFPEGQDLINAQTAYRPVDAAGGTIYVQPQYTATLLSNFAKANRRLLSTMQVSKQHQLPIPIQPNTSLSRLAEMGSGDPDLAWPVWQALWSELTSPSKEGAQAGFQRPPILVSMDGVDQTMRLSAYLDENVNPIHAHDLALVKHFMDLLGGQTPLPNGGMIIAAICASNRASSPTLDHCLEKAYVQQHNSSLNAEISETVKPLPVPEWNPFIAKDARVEAAMNGVQSVKLQGLSKDEARGVMEYYAKSGMLRGVVTEGFVSERWTMGSGVIGELEKATVRARF